MKEENKVEDTYTNETQGGPKCPYCGEIEDDFEVIYADEDEWVEYECGCGKTYEFATHKSYSWEARPLEENHEQ